MDDTIQKVSRAGWIRLYNIAGCCLWRNMGISYKYKEANALSMMRNDNKYVVGYNLMRYHP